jgi:hypothetical protein
MQSHAKVYYADFQMFKGALQVIMSAFVTTGVRF